MSFEQIRRRGVIPLRHVLLVQMSIDAFRVVECVLIAWQLTSFRFLLPPTTFDRLFQRSSFIFLRHNCLVTCSGGLTRVQVDLLARERRHPDSIQILPLHT